MSNITVMDGENGVLDMFKAIERGDFLLDIEEHLKKVVDAVVENRKAGELSITLKFDYDAQTDAMKVVPKVRSKMPEKPKRASLFFVTPNGKLSRYDSRQREMFEHQEMERVRVENIRRDGQGQIEIINADQHATSSDAIQQRPQII